jgi:hypothetical protein
VVTIAGTGRACKWGLSTQASVMAGKRFWSLLTARFRHEDISDGRGLDTSMRIPNAEPLAVTSRLDYKKGYG